MNTIEIRHTLTRAEYNALLALFNELNDVFRALPDHLIFVFNKYLYNQLQFTN